MRAKRRPWTWSDRSAGLTHAFSLDGTRLAAGNYDGTARILDAETGEEIARIEHVGPALTLAFSPDGI